jgi:uncharacterized repeat protein (TIGR03806 family)
MLPRNARVRGPRTALVLSVAVVVAVAAVLGACGDDELRGAAADAGVSEAAVPDANAPDVGDRADARDGAPVRAEFGLDVRPKNTTCRAPARPPVAEAVTLQQVYADVTVAYAGTNPVQLAQPPGEKTRWFAATLQGKLSSFPAVNPSAPPTVVADLPAVAGIPLALNGESGFLGFAFHPKFAQNGRIYVSWNSEDGPYNLRSRIGYLTSTNGGTTFTSYTNILLFDQPVLYYHHGGGVAFGPDGYLYASFGDGGEEAHGQDTSSFFSKIIRIDVDNVPVGETYRIPADNPFKSGGGEPATFAYGFRNPFRFTFDRATGELWAADVGGSSYEEVDLVKSGGNYGWPCREGLHDLSVDPMCATAKLGAIDPVVEVVHDAANPSRAIIGGFVYRGSAIPLLVGSYFFGDDITGEIFVMTFDPTTGAPSTKVINPSGPPVHLGSFSEDSDGEIYAVSLEGPVFKVVAAPTDAGASAPAFPSRLSATGCDPRVATGLIPFTVNAPYWSDGAEKDRWLALPDGATIKVGADGDFDMPIGSVLVKLFSLGGKKVETRLLVRHDDGGWAGYTYEWLEDQSDAVLLLSSKSKRVGAQTWSFPSRSDCARCHTQAAGNTLGLELGQLNGDLLYPSTNRISNQLHTLEHINLFDAPLGKPVAQIDAYPVPSAAGPVEPRARAYLHSNCSMCHRPSGGGRGTMDLRFANTLAATKTCDVVAQTGDLGTAGTKLLVPGKPSLSQISIRPHALDAKRMPPIASHVVDTSNMATVDAWITSLNACP